MSVPCTCPHCAESFKVKDKYVGREGACPKCRGRIHIHTDGHVTAVARQDRASASTERRQPTQAQKIVDAAVTRESASDDTQRVRCKTCGSEQRVRPEWAGKKVKCSVCGAALALPESLRTRGGTSNSPSTSEDGDYLISLLEEEAAAGEPLAPADLPNSPTTLGEIAPTTRKPAPARQSGVHWPRIVSSGEMYQFLFVIAIFVVAAIVSGEMESGLVLLSTVGVINLICWIVAVVNLTNHDNGRLAFWSIALMPCCCIGYWMAFIFGWAHAAQHATRGIMLSWTIGLIIAVPLNLMFPVSERISAEVERIKAEQEQRQRGNQPGIEPGDGGPFKRPTRSATSTQSVVMVEIRSSQDGGNAELPDQLLDEIGEALHHFVDKGGPSSSMMSRGTTKATCILAPVADVRAFATQIEVLGEVSDVDVKGRRIKLIVDPQKPVPKFESVDSHRMEVRSDLAERTKQRTSGDESGHGDVGAAPRPSDPIDAAILDLTTGQSIETRTAAERLARMEVDEQRRDEVVDALIVGLKRHGIHVRDEIFPALDAWTTEEHMDRLILLIGETTGFVQRDCMNFVAKKGGQRAAVALAELLVHPQLDPKEALKKMGPVAEDAVLPYVTHPKDAVRRDACEILEVIGTAKSLREINKLARDRSIFSRKAAEKAYYAIEWREKHKQQSQQDGSDETEHTQTPRSEVLRPAE